MYTIFLHTDLEPDDAVALRILVRAGLVPSYVCVSEGTDIKLKMARAHTYLKLLTDQDIVYVEGETSDRPFPREGSELTCLKMTPLYPEHTMDYSDALDRWSRAEYPLMIMIAPPRKLLRLTVPSLLSRATLLMYGGFNFRACMTDPQDIVSLLSQFKQVVLYEKRTATAEIPFDRQTSPSFFWRLETSQEIYHKIVYALNYLWNNHMGYSTDQMVLADQGLVTAFLLPKYQRYLLGPFRLSFDMNRNTQLDPDSTGSVFSFQNIPFEDLVVDLIKLTFGSFPLTSGDISGRAHDS